MKAEDFIQYTRMKPGDGLFFRIVNPRPVKYLISYDGFRRTYPRWVYFAQQQMSAKGGDGPFCEARVGTIHLLDIPTTTKEDIERIDDGLCAMYPLRTHKLTLVRTGRSHDRRSWRTKVIDCGAEFNFEDNELIKYSYNSLINIAKHRQKRSNQSQKYSPYSVVYGDVLSEPDKNGIPGLAVEELFPEYRGVDLGADREGCRPAVKTPHPAPAAPKVLTADEINVALYDARMAKASREVTEPLLKKWLELTGRRQPGWW